MKIIYSLLELSCLNLAGIFVFCSVSLGSGGGVVSAGSFIGYGGNETGYRQLLKLHSNGEILSATPENSTVLMITLYAPGLAGGELIIREIDLSDQEKSILICTTEKIRTKIKRATIYLAPRTKDVLLYQESQNGWECLEPIQLIAPVPLIADGFNEYWAYSVTALGLFRISNGVVSPQTGTVFNPNNGLFPMGSINSGFFPWVCAGLLLNIIVLFSHIVHKMECRGTE